MVPLSLNCPRHAAICWASQESCFRYFAEKCIETNTCSSCYKSTKTTWKGTRKRTWLKTHERRQCTTTCFSPRGLHIYCMFICKTVILNCNSGIFLMAFCREKTRNLLINHGQFHKSDKPDEQEKLSKSSRTRIVHPSNCLRNSTASLMTGNSSRVPSVIFCPACCGDAACSISNSSLEKRSCQRAA